MSTRALQIRDSILVKLRAASVAGVTSDRVFSDLKPALLSALRPAIVVDMGDEETPERKYGKVHRGQSITVRIIEDAADPYAALDPIRIAAHALIMADKTLSGLCETIEEGATSRERADLDVPIGSLTTTYLARYTTTAELLT
jgi:hypothetical protein